MSSRSSRFLVGERFDVAGSWKFSLFSFCSSRTSRRFEPTSGCCSVISGCRAKVGRSSEDLKMKLPNYTFSRIFCQPVYSVWDSHLHIRNPNMKELLAISLRKIREVVSGWPTDQFHYKICNSFKCYNASLKELKYIICYKFNSIWRPTNIT